MNRVPRVALVGVSGYGRAYLEWLEPAVERGEVRFVAAVVVNAAEEAETCARLKSRGVEIFDSWQAMLQSWAGRLDLCCVPAPIHLHAEITVAALEAGANVLVEKPLAASLAQVDAIEAAERTTGRWVAVGYQDFYLDSTRRIAEELAAGRIGQVKSLKLLGGWPRPWAYFQRNAWAGRMAVNGRVVRDSPLNNAMAHFVNLSLYWAGAQAGRPVDPEAVQAELFRGYPIESFDTAVVRLLMPGEVKLQMAVTHCCSFEQPISLRIQGEGGRLDWTFRKGAEWISRGGKTEQVPLENRSSSMAVMFAAVMARFQRDNVRICSVAQARPQVACIEALSGKIHPIAPAWLDDCELPNGRGLSIRNGIADLKRCLETAGLPSEIGVVWAPQTGVLAAA